MPKIIFCFHLLFFVFFAQNAIAADLNLIPSSGSYNVGDTIQVRVVLASADKSANAVSATIDFPRALLTLSSISKTNSIVSLWPVDPSFSNASGTANLEGIILGGYQGQNGAIVTLTFKAKAVGTANIKFISSSVLANDGLGTNILSGTGLANFAISPLKEKVIELADTPAKVLTPKQDEAPPVKVLTPVFTDYSENVAKNGFLAVIGLADPLSDILLTSDRTVPDGGTIQTSAVVKADEKGVFNYASKSTESGTYTITAQARNKNGVLSEKSLPITISVASEPISPVVTSITDTLSVVITIISMIILLVLIAIWGWYRILHYRESMRKRLADVRNITTKSFDILNEDVKDEIKIFRKVKALQSLTPEERLFINQFKKDIEAAEKVILDKARE